MMVLNIIFMILGMVIGSQCAVTTLPKSCAERCPLLLANLLSQCFIWVVVCCVGSYMKLIGMSNYRM